jgi:dienelactone hydrolase
MRMRSASLISARLIGAIVVALILSAAAARAQENQQESKQEHPQETQANTSPLTRVTFPALDGKTTLVAHLAHPHGNGPRAALVLLHGCSGLQADGRIFPLYRDWALQLLGHGYTVLLPDSAGSRGFTQTCTESDARRITLAERPKDAYAALKYLQSLPDVRADRIGVLGWSQGGGTILRAIGARSFGRPAALAADFRAAVAFYPGLCSERLQSRPFVDAEPHAWTTAIPLLVLQGEADNWTPAGPCAAFIADAKARGAAVEFKLYANAYHVFDGPNYPLRELPAYRMPNGVVPITGTEPAARADALMRVPEFLKRHLAE